MKQDVRILLVGERKSAALATVAIVVSSLIYLTNLMYLFTFFNFN